MIDTDKEDVSSGVSFNGFSGNTSKTLIIEKITAKKELENTGS